jgi:coiled-coil domain-containing protein 63/114
MSLKPPNRASETSSSSNRKTKLEALKQEASSIKTQIEFNSIDPSTLLVQSDIYRLQDQSDTYSRKIQIEKKKIEELKAQVEHLNQEIENKRKENLINSSKNKANAEAYNRKIKSLENKIDKGLQKLNEILASNKSLIDKIDKIRKERIIYTNMCKQLETELNKKQEEMKQIVEASNQAIKEKEDTKKKLHELKLEAEKEHEEFESEWRTLEKLIIRDTTSKEFITEGAQEIEENERTLFLEGDIEARAAHDKSLIDYQKEKLKKYEEELATLTQKTNLSSLDDIVKVYLDSEMQNFSLFNHVNELSGEMEQLDIQIAEIRSKINKHKIPDTQSDIERKLMIREYQLKLEKLNLKEEEFNKINERTKKTMHSLVDGVKILCNKLSIEYDEINEKNMIALFAEVEKKLDERISDKKVKNVKANSETAKKIEIDTPMVIEREEDEEIGVPMTTDEIRYKSLRKLNEENDKRFRRK